MAELPVIDTTAGHLTKLNKHHAALHTALLSVCAAQTAYGDTCHLLDTALRDAQRSLESALSNISDLAPEKIHAERANEGQLLKFILDHDSLYSCTVTLRTSDNKWPIAGVLRDV